MESEETTREQEIAEFLEWMLNSTPYIICEWDIEGSVGTSDTNAEIVAKYLRDRGES